LFHRLAEQHGCTEKSLEQSVVQFVYYARTLSTTFFQADMIVEERLPLTVQPKGLLSRGFRLCATQRCRYGIRAGEMIDIDGANSSRSAGNKDRRFQGHCFLL
jgi:hypothetical protein